MRENLSHHPRSRKTGLKADPAMSEQKAGCVFLDKIGLLLS